MKKLFLCMALVLPMIYSCSDDMMELEKVTVSTPEVLLPRYNNVVRIDSMYAYHGDSLYREMVSDYNNMPESEVTTRALSPEDHAFFSKAMIVKSTESTLLYGKNYIYPGSILEGNSISEQQYIPVFVNNRNPITVSMTLSHNTPKPTSRTIASPTFSKLSDYVKEMVVDGNFSQNERFMFQFKRFTFYDEIKSAFGSNVDTKKLFSSKKVSTTEYEEKIMKSSAMYVKFSQSSFTVNMDIEPLANQTVQGNTIYEPVYVSSVTYGRLGVLAFETDESYEFAESCIKKEFNNILFNRTSTLTIQEERFFENTDFKILIIGADSDYAVQTVKGYPAFLNLIKNSHFTEHSYGVPITCSFSYANTHGLVEIEFDNSVFVEPLFVRVSNESSSYNMMDNGNYTSSNDMYLNFYKDRAKTTVATPYIDIAFDIDYYENTTFYIPDLIRWPMVSMNSTSREEKIKMRNIQLKNRLYVGRNHAYYESTGPFPSFDQPRYSWSATEYYCRYSLRSSPFFLIIN